MGMGEVPARVAAVVLAALLVAVVAVEYPRRFDAVQDWAARNEAQSPDERLLRGAYAIDISREFLLAALRLLPRDAEYAVETGKNVEVSTEITLTALPAYARSLLLPRRQRAFFEQDVDYLLSYGCELNLEGRAAGLEVLWDEEEGPVIDRRRR